MIVERIVFNVLAFGVFVIIFSKLIRKNETLYTNILILEFLGILIRFIEIIGNWKMNLQFISLIYIFAVIVPVLVIYLESKGFLLYELVYLGIAKYNLLIKNNEKLRKILIKIIKKCPKSYLAHKMLAETYEKEEKFSQSIDEYIRAIELNKTDYKSYLKVSELLNKVDKTEESIIMLKDLLKKKPSYFEASDLLGTILYNEERFKEAITVYFDALKYNCANYEIYYNLGMIYTRLNDFQKAKEYYEKAAKLNTAIYNGNFNIGQIALIIGDLEEAENYFMQCIQNENLEIGAYYYLAQVALLKGEKDKAINYLNLAIELNYKIYKKVQELPIFVVIKKDVKKPVEKNMIKSKLSLKERKTRRTFRSYI